MLRSEKAAMQKIQEDMYRIRMEKACMLLLSRWKEDNNARRIKEIQEKAEAEKAAIVVALKEVRMGEKCGVKRGEVLGEI